MWYFQFKMGTVCVYVYVCVRVWEGESADVVCGLIYAEKCIL